MTQPIRFGALFGLAAASAMAASPALAADLSQPSAPAPSPAQIGFVPSAWKAETAGHHRYRRWHHRRNRIDAGDVIVGALVIGGIAAIASSASKNERERRRERERDYDRRYEERRYDERRNTRGSGSRGLDNAVDQCVERVERDVRHNSKPNTDTNKTTQTIQ